MKKFFAVLTAVAVVALLAWAAPQIFATSSVTATGDLATGSFTSTGSATNVSIGWTPKSVLVTKATNTLAQGYWVSGMAAASCLRTANTGTAGYVVISVPTVSCISTYAGSSTAAVGFTLGADTVLNINGDTVRWEAHR